MQFVVAAKPSADSQYWTGEVMRSKESETYEVSPKSHNLTVTAQIANALRSETGGIR